MDFPIGTRWREACDIYMQPMVTYIKTWLSRDGNSSDTGWGAQTGSFCQIRKLSIAYVEWELPSGTPLSTVSFPKSRKTGPANPLTAIRRSELYPLHQNSNWPLSHSPPRPSPLSDRHRTNTRTAASASPEAARRSAQVELHDLTKSVKLFLRRSEA